MKAEGLAAASFWSHVNYIPMGLHSIMIWNLQTYQNHKCQKGVKMTLAPFFRSCNLLVDKEMRKFPGFICVFPTLGSRCPGVPARNPREPWAVEVDGFVQDLFSEMGQKKHVILIDCSSFSGFCPSLWGGCVLRGKPMGFGRSDYDFQG